MAATRLLYYLFILTQASSVKRNNGWVNHRRWHIREYICYARRSCRFEAKAFKPTSRISLLFYLKGLARVRRIVLKHDLADSEISSLSEIQSRISAPRDPASLCYVDLIQIDKEAGSYGSGAWCGRASPSVGSLPSD